jgi:hypothetical protein
MRLGGPRRRVSLRSRPEPGMRSPGRMLKKPRRRLKMYGEEAQVTTAVAPAAQFTALDRCDRCGAQAYVRVEFAAGGELLFCAHHAREHSEKLQQVAAAIQDETNRLAPVPPAND